MNSWKIAEAFISGLSDAFDAGFAGGGKRKRRTMGIYDIESRMKAGPDYDAAAKGENPFKSKDRQAWNPFSWWKM